MPLLAYGAMLVGNRQSGRPSALDMIEPFAMGLPLLAAVGELVYARRI